MSPREEKLRDFRHRGHKFRPMLCRAVERSRRPGPDFTPIDVVAHEPHDTPAAHVRLIYGVVVVTWSHAR